MLKRSLGHLGEIDIEQWREEPDFLLGPFWVGDFAPELSTKTRKRTEVLWTNYDYA